MEPSLYDEMFEVEEKHWWFSARRRIILYMLKLLSRRYGSFLGDIKVCDIGCGTGGTLKELQKSFDAVGMESDEAALKLCRARGVRAFKGELPGDIPFSRESFDFVLMLDVLEHLNDDQAAIREVVNLLKPGGIIICTVPAYQWLWTKHDEIFHHKRRYNKKILSGLFERLQLETVRLTYFNFFIFPVALSARAILGSLNVDLSMERKTPHFIVNILFEKIFGTERFIIPYINFPFGLSLICVARRR